jgi:hypothetical protein
MQGLVARTRELFQLGHPLAKLLNPGLRVDIQLFARGGLAVLDAIEGIGYNTIQHRPTLSGLKKCRLLGQALGSHLLSKITRNRE